jgi:hypothetical protein
MKIERHLLPRMSLEKFAKLYDLVMEIHEREPSVLPRFYAHFKGAEVKDGTYSRVLSGAYGDGDTPEKAMENYAGRISMKLLVLNAMGVDRKEIEVPILT